ncbi:glycosyltransferase [Paracoccus aurantiacus]|uniref:Glycosyltransferase n=1 Tax=Paracoccus aurantiacus TaxID=2599412 RepID=A0A5C6RXS9_9RHOB|nr:glycosyltransferase [Paracoccus aurantiacus]TXB66430.1 glycosyltransferase [Paracoccus aurantiacus]
MAPAKIVHVITGTAIGGAEIMLLRYLRALGDARSNHTVVSMMPCGPVADMIRDAGVEVIDLQAGSAARIPSAIGRLRSIIARKSPDVVHGWMYHGSLISALALRLARRADIGLVWAIHHSLSDPAKEKPMTRAVLRGLRMLSGRADCLTYCSRQSAEQHLAYGLEADRNEFVPNAIDTTEFRPDPLAGERLRAAAGIPEGRFVVGSVARAHPMKDHVSFTRAVAALAERGMDVHGVLIGAGQPDSPAAAEASKLGIKERFTALPARDDIAQLMPGLDVYLLSSAWGEALPLAVGEAMASGVIPVVTDIGDCAWLVGDSGATCPPERPDLMADAIQHFLQLPPAEREALAAGARARIEDQLSMRDYIARHDEIYHRARAERSAAQPAVAA